jgi:hypothetical protein
MTDNNNNKRRIFIREHVYKKDGHLDQIEFEFIHDFEAESLIERNYSLWLTPRSLHKNNFTTIRL